MRKRWSVIVMLSFCCLALSGCSRPGEETGAGAKGDLAKERLYAGYPFDAPGALDLGVQPLSMPEGSVSELLTRDGVLAAQLKAQNLVLRPFPFYKGKNIQELMTRGDLEAGFLGDMPAISAAASGDIVIVAMVKQGFSSIVAGGPMLVKDLKGKRVATGLGSTAHFTLLNALENEGLTERDVELVGMEVTEMPKALAEGRIDAFSAWEPTPVMALAAHPEFHLVHKGLNFAFLCLRRDFVAAHPEEARNIAAAVARACLWMRQPGNLDRAAHWITASASGFQGAPYGLTADQAIAITRNDLLNIPIAPQIPERLLREKGMLWKEFTFLKRLGKIPEATPWSRIQQSFDLDMLRGVQADGKGRAPASFDYREGGEERGAR